MKHLIKFSKSSSIYKLIRYNSVRFMANKSNFKLKKDDVKDPEINDLNQSGYASFTNQGNKSSNDLFI